MANPPQDWQKELGEALARAGDALSRGVTPPRAPVAPEPPSAPFPPAAPWDRDKRRRRRMRRVARLEAAGRLGGPPLKAPIQLFVMAAIAGILGGALHLPWLVPVAVALGVAGSVTMAIWAIRFALSMAGQLPGMGQPGVGLGANIESGATVDPTARIEMGANVRAGAVVKAGAVVGMGSVVERDAVIEENAVLRWGVVVRQGARVGAGAQLGSGSVLEAGATLAAGTRVGAGAHVSAGGAIHTHEARPEHAPAPVPVPVPGQGDSAPARQPAPAAPVRPPVDPRDERVDAVCDRLERDIAQSPERVRDFLGKPGETVASLRRTCHDLLRRERALRAEAAPAELERLDRESKALEDRIAAETDEVVRERLRGAVGAIDEQRRQRALLLRNANRLEAEFTRLAWTLESLSAQILRLRSADAESGDAADAELHRGLARLREEVDAVADAIEQVNRADVAAPLPEPVPAPARLDPELAVPPGEAASETPEAGARERTPTRRR